MYPYRRNADPSSRPALPAKLPPVPSPTTPPQASGAPFEFELYQLAHLAISEDRPPRPAHSGLRAA